MERKISMRSSRDDLIARGVLKEVVEEEHGVIIDSNGKFRILIKNII